MKALRRSASNLAMGTLVILLVTTSSASADVISVVSDTTNWQQSTVVQFDDTHPGWGGPPGIPAASTFTIDPTAGAGHVANVAGSTNIYSGNGIRYYRTLFNLEAFSSISLDIQMSADNDMWLGFNNGHMATEGSLDGVNFADAIHHRLFIDTDGSVTNGYLGGDSFDFAVSSFDDSVWNVGSNELVLAVRNLSGFDSGGFSFGMTVTTTSVPAPAPLVLLALGLLSITLRIKRTRV